MLRTCVFGMPAFFLAATFGIGGETPKDTDGDGIFDAHEELLGTDPGSPDRFQVVLDEGLESEARRAGKGFDATKDFTTIEFCHVGDDRYLWRATFATEPRLEDTVFHLYVDADADDETGRKGPAGAASTGTEYMLSVVGGRGTSGYYDPEGNRTYGPPVTHVVQGNTLIVSADVNLGRNDEGVRYALYVLCHTISQPGTSPGMSDSSGKRPIQGVPLSNRKKVMRPGDHADNFRVAATFGNAILKTVLRSDETIVVPHDKLQLDGFSVDLFTSRRWPHLRFDGTPARAWTEAPKAGRYHVGFMMFDDANDERVVFSIDNKLEGVAVANRDNNRTWLYWLQEPIDFQGGERVELRAAGASGKHGIVNIVFLPRPPEIRTIRYEVENMTAAAHVGSPGRVTISWTTTWPSPTHFEYGKDANYGQVVQTEGNCLVHRVVLDGLDPEAEYHGHAIGTARDGSPFSSSDFAFRAAPPGTDRRLVPPETTAEIRSVPIAVRSPHSFSVEGWPVTSGIPFPRGELGSADHVRLMRGDEETPAQIRLTARWPDGSVKWLLVTFQASAPAEGENEYRLEFGRDISRAPVADAITADEGSSGVAVDTGPLRFRIDRHGNLADVQRDGNPLLAADATAHTRAVDAGGASYSTASGEAEITIEEAGPLRAVVKIVSHLTGADGAKLMRIEKRVEAYRGKATLRVHHTFVMDRPETFTGVKELSYRIPIFATDAKWRVPLAGGQYLELDQAAAVRQRFDDEYVTFADGRETPAKDRVIGSIILLGEKGCAVAVRDFWQNYPKGFSLRTDALSVDLCPAFKPGPYDAFPFEKEQHQLYYYLLDGQYRLKRGVSKTHEIFLSFEPEQMREQSCAVFQRPLLATASPDWYCGTKVFYDVAPRNEERFKLYEEAIDRNLQGYRERRERQHDFGMLNYGDWYGERGTNWGNIEYDTQHAFFLEYIRSGNPDAFFLGAATELHNRDIDTVQWSEDPKEVGAVYVHQMCHVGRYYDKPVPGSLGFPSGGYTVSHAWTEGHFDHYFLTGDRRSYETGCAVADFFIRKELGKPYDFLTCRTPGWHLIMLAAAYAATDDPYYLNAAKVVVERVLETQDQEPRPLPDYQAEGRKPYQVGGWSRMMVPGHCRCEPRHRGNAGFMVAVLLSGLKYYHDLTGDPRVKECIIQGAYNLVEETYSDETHGFRYTSCPNTSYGSGASPLMVEGVARAYLWTKDERFRRVLTEALARGAGGSPYGKGFSMYYRMAPRVLADLDAAGITLDKPAEESP